jgi:antitoxin component YwqK of YwqJK toxin-antitoxin module
MDENIENPSKRNENWCWYIPEGKNVGEWRTTDGNDNPPDGKYTFFYCNGNLAQIQPRHDGKKCDTMVTYNLKGVIQEYTTYKNDEVFNYYINDGPYTDYNLDCSIYLTGMVKNHKRTGKWTWYKNKSKIDYIENYLDSVTHIRMDYYESGQMKDSGRIVDHKQDGMVRYWYENGNNEQICFWKNGLQDSISTFFFENGTVKSTANWRLGNRHGESLSYSENGKLLKKLKYDEGLQIEYNEFDENGKKK